MCSLEPTRGLSSTPKKSGDHTLRGSEVNNLPIIIEHVDLLNSLDWLHIQLLQRALQLLVVGTGTLVSLLDFPAGSALSADSDGGSLGLEPCEFGLVHDSPELRISQLTKRDRVLRQKRIGDLTLVDSSGSGCLT
jgi:hypothetical protein